jgi:sporulation protein YlmC with PRC-barrel domain
MHKTISGLVAVTLSLALATTALAQTRPASPSSEPSGTKRDTGRAEKMRQAWAPDSNAVEARKIIGMKVKNEQNKDVGEVDQLIVDPTSGKISHVVLGKGGVMGVGEQKLVLNWSDLKMQPDPNNRTRLVATVDQSKLDSAPRYEARRDRETPAASPRTSTPSSTETKPSSSESKPKN